MGTKASVIFNELSCMEVPNGIYDAVGTLRRFVDTLREGFRLGFERVRATSQFWPNGLIGGQHVRELVKHLDKDSREFLFLLFSAPYIDKIVCEEIGADDKQEFVPFCFNPSGLVSAILVDTVAVSFDCGAKWQQSHLEFDINCHWPKCRLAGPKTVRHAASVSHWESHLVWASRKCCSKEQLSATPENPLPNSKFSNQLARDDWAQFLLPFTNAPANEKTAKLRVTGADVAWMNGYARDERLSSLNSRRADAIRDVFRSEFSDPPMYLSLDLEKSHGAFEVLDSAGRHLGEWMFSGVQNRARDRNGDHDIAMA